MEQHLKNAPKIFQTTAAVFAWFEEFFNLEQKTNQPVIHEYRLERMGFLLNFFKNPQDNYKIIHVAGSKGKGSTAGFIASILAQAGFTTGLYTSPHVVSYMERITVIGREINPEIITALGSMIKSKLENISLEQVNSFPHPTTFELLTLLAFLVYKEQGCDYVVVETGLGGRLDATNVVHPIASVITLVEKEHTEILGDTLELIAAEKGGIIKERVPVFTSSQEPCVTAVLKRISCQKNSPFYYLPDYITIGNIKQNRAGLYFDLQFQRVFIETLTSAMIGSFQAQNASLALLTLKYLFPFMPLETIKKGIANSKIPGRFEVFEGAPCFVLDAAHTPASIQLVTDNFLQLFPGKAILIFGSIKGKKFIEMAEILCPHFHEIIISTPGTFKESDPEILFETFKGLNPNTVLLENPEDAFRYAKKLSGDCTPVLVTGSFYMIGEIRKFL